MVLIFFVIILLLLALLVWALPYIILAVVIGIPIYVTYRVIKRHENHQSESPRSSFQEAKPDFNYDSDSINKGTPPYQGKYYSRGEEELLTGRNPQEKPWQGQSSPNGSNYYQNQARDKLLKSMLESIGISEEDAKLVFGSYWKRKLTKSGYDDQFASDILKIQTKIMFDLDYRKEIIHLVDKLISTIDFVIDAFPETAKKYAKNLGPYEEIYIHQWEVFKKYKKTSFEINSENELTVSEAYKILELGITATIEQVKKRFRELALKWHPDRNKANKTQAEQMFVKINKAYETIMEAA